MEDEGTFESIFECNACNEFLYEAENNPLTCPNGDAIHRACYERVNACPSCRVPKPFIIFLAMGRLLTRFMFPCAHNMWACTKELLAKDKKPHEDMSCPFIPIRCIIPGCNSSHPLTELPVHFINDHKIRVIQGNVNTLTYHRQSNRHNYSKLTMINSFGKFFIMYYSKMEQDRRNCHNFVFTIYCLDTVDVSSKFSVEFTFSGLGLQVNKFQVNPIPPLELDLAKDNIVLFSDIQLKPFFRQELGGTVEVDVRIGEMIV